jgi:transcriptional regulator with XRE-family HTH domain
MASSDDPLEQEVADSVSKRIVQALADTGWSQRELAARSDVSPMLISQLIRKEVAASAATLVQIADAVGCRVLEFFPERG